MKKRVLSGMRPTGPLHLGHLLGALNNWVSLQEEYECLFMVADWHALMSEYQNPKKIQENVLGCVVDWISSGVVPEKSTIFVQSHVKEHLELAMVLSDITPLPWLERCPTYKEQLREQKGRDLATYGFLGYPVLQAADILLYKAQAVPVGEDQLPHLELTREIVRRFHSLYGKEIFPEPKPILTQTPKLLGLDNRKMSKTFGNYIALCDSPELITKKTSQMFTDPKRIKFSDPGHPYKCNVYDYYKIFKPDYAHEVSDYCRHARVGCTECKRNLGQVLIQTLDGFQKKRQELLKDKSRIDNILKAGQQKAGRIASATISEVKELAGLA